MWKYLLGIAFISLLILYYFIFLPVNSFPVNKTFKIGKGVSGERVYISLQQNGYIKSVFFAKVLDKAFFNLPMQSGEYNFKHPLSLWQMMIALRIPPAKVRITIPEGFTLQQVADRLEKNLNSNFDPELFLEKVKEGEVFPETYYFPGNISTYDIIAIIEKERDINYKTLSKYPSDQEVILASILEREAKDEKSMKMVAGIINNRLRINMPIQVDATILYAKGWKDKVTFKDLKFESEYNTYLNRGLPPGAISNPGIVALDAAINPSPSNFLYYLTGKDGKMYYAKTFGEHVRNKNKYLK